MDRPLFISPKFTGTLSSSPELLSSDILLRGADFILTFAINQFFTFPAFKKGDYTPGFVLEPIESLLASPSRLQGGCGGADERGKADELLALFAHQSQGGWIHMCGTDKLAPKDRTTWQPPKT
jgi:hypothetical protein